MVPRKLLAVCAVFLLLATTVFGSESQNSETQSDLWLKAKLVTAYTLNQHLNPFRIHVEIKDGVAHLSGTVDSDVERDLAVEIAKGVDGIREVKDDIEVVPGAMAGERREPKFFRTVEDATITARVKSRLLWNRNTNGLAIDVDTDNGVVTLKGRVASGAHRDLAVQLAKNTTGVKQVKDELKVVSSPKEAVEKNPLQRVETRASDTWITTKVKSVLLFSKDAENAEIEVSTSNQVVTLRGAVVSEDQKEKILKLVGDVVGVKEVRSKLVVEKG